MPSYYRLLPALALALLATAGCGDGDSPVSNDEGPVFNNQGGRQISCMQHQSAPPGSRYTDPERPNPAGTLAVLRYYTAHGSKPYCNGAPPTEADRAWAEFYVRQGADRSHVTPILDGRDEP